ncbi:MAG: SGNH/GDSL hydrolase family protein [Planctomycetota bacterium]
MRNKVSYYLLAPILYFQGRRVQRSIPRLPEPPGQRSGAVGAGSLIRLLIVGDSAAAGVGAPDLDSALPGHLVSQLSQQYKVEWKLIAKTGATTELILRRLKKQATASFHIAVTSLGVNDATAGIPCKEWLRQQAELRQTLRDKFNVSRIFVSGLPPVGRFPALPQPLRWYLGQRAREFDNAIRGDLENEEGSTYIDLRFTDDAGLMASDGFHPGPEIYRGWASKIYEEFLRLESMHRFLTNA